MTEAEWLTCVDPAAMLVWITAQPADRASRGNVTHYVASDRKLRLFACACCRQPEVWDGVVCGWCAGIGTRLEDVNPGYCATVTCEVCRGTGRTGGISDPRSRRAVEVAERYADGEATEEELAEANRRGHDACVEGVNRTQSKAEATHFAHALCRPILDVPRLFAGSEFGRPPSATQAALLRCIVGNPWRPAQSPPEWLRYARPAWLTPTVHNLARTIYEDRRWGDLGILADALEEADCPAEVTCSECGGKGKIGGGAPLASSTAQPVVTDHARCHGIGRIPNPLLAHLRSGDIHARGCWVVDLILGKS